MIDTSSVVAVDTPVTPTPIIEYTPSDIDEYEVIVLLPEYWDEIHNYIINENEIDGIPNRRITCINEKCSSLRTAVYEMSAAEADVLKAHEKIEAVELNPDKYPQPSSTRPMRFKEEVTFNKLLMNNAATHHETDYHKPFYKNNKQSNWALRFMADPVNSPFESYAPGPVGVGSTTISNGDLAYSYTGKGVDAITVDAGGGVLHPEFIDDDGTYRLRDVILDGPYYLDPDYFDTNNYTYTKVLDGNTIGVGIASDKAREWWTDSTKRSAKFSSLDTITTIDSRYTYGQAVATSEHTNDPNPILDSHGVSCASQIGGKTFGYAFKANLWSLRIAFGGVNNGFVGGATATDITRIFHQAKKINDPIDPNPTITNNSWGTTDYCGNTLNQTYDIGYRGTTTTYTGNGSNSTPVPAAKGFNNTLTALVNNPHLGQTWILSSTPGGYTVQSAQQDQTSAAAEDAIAAGVIIVTAAGNTNQKVSDHTDVDFGNWYDTNTNFTSRCGGIEKGFSGDHEKDKGAIRVGVLACCGNSFHANNVDRQGQPAYGIKKAEYSTNGPMIDIWAPGEATMAAQYWATYTTADYMRKDNSSFYDGWFGGTSSACPHVVGLLCLYLESNRKANQDDVRNWLKTDGSKKDLITDVEPDETATNYWSQAWAFNTEWPDRNWQHNIVRGNSNLRGAPNRVAYNPFATASEPKMKGVKFSGISFKQT